MGQIQAVSMDSTQNDNNNARRQISGRQANSVRVVPKIARIHHEEIVHSSPHEPKTPGATMQLRGGVKADENTDDTENDIDEAHITEDRSNHNDHGYFNTNPEKVVNKTKTLSTEKSSNTAVIATSDIPQSFRTQGHLPSTPKERIITITASKFPTHSHPKEQAPPHTNALVGSSKLVFSPSQPNAQNLRQRSTGSHHTFNQTDSRTPQTSRSSYHGMPQYCGDGPPPSSPAVHSNGRIHPSPSSGRPRNNVMPWPMSSAQSVPGDAFLSGMPHPQLGLIGNPPVAHQPTNRLIGNPPVAHQHQPTNRLIGNPPVAHQPMPTSHQVLMDSSSGQPFVTPPWAHNVYDNYKQPHYTSDSTYKMLKSQHHNYPPNNQKCNNVCRNTCGPRHCCTYTDPRLDTDDDLKLNLWLPDPTIIQNEMKKTMVMADFRPVSPESVDDTKSSTPDNVSEDNDLSTIKVEYLEQTSAVADSAEKDSNNNNNNEKSQTKSVRERFVQRSEQILEEIERQNRELEEQNKVLQETVAKQTPKKGDSEKKNRKKSESEKTILGYKGSSRADKSKTPKRRGRPPKSTDDKVPSENGKKNISAKTKITNNPEKVASSSQSVKTAKDRLTEIKETLAESNCMIKQEKKEVTTVKHGKKMATPNRQQKTPYKSKSDSDAVTKTVKRDTVCTDNQTTVPKAVESSCNLACKSEARVTGMRKWDSEPILNSALERSPLLTPDKNKPTLSQMRLQDQLSEAYDLLMANWADYLSLDMATLRDMEIKNAKDHGYNDESLAMLEDSSLYVWQLIEEMAYP